MQNINKIFAIPFGYILSAFYAFSHNYLLSLFILTLIIRLFLVPSAIKQQKGAAKQMRLQPKVNKIRAKYASEGRDGQMKIQQETQDLYKREGYSALNASCVPLLFQLPVMMGLFGLIYTPLTNVLHLSSDLVSQLTTAVQSYLTSIGQSATKISGQIEIYVVRYLHSLDLTSISGLTSEIINQIDTFGRDFQVFGIDLTLTPWENRTDWKMWLIPILSGLTSALTMIFTTLRQKKTAPETMKGPAAGCMLLYGPGISVYFAFILPAGVGVYWIMSNIISFAQTVILNLVYTPSKVIAIQMVDETVQRRSREKSVKQIAALDKAAD